METNEIDREFGHGSTGTHRVNVPLTKKRKMFPMSFPQSVYQRSVTTVKCQKTKNKIFVFFDLPS